MAHDPYYRQMLEWSRQQKEAQDRAMQQQRID